MASVRTATEKDIPRILDLYDQLSLDGKVSARQEEIPSVYEKALREITELPGCEIIVAESDGQVIGTCTLMIVPNLSHNGAPWIIVENVVVDETSRGTGIGKLLMDYIGDQAREHGCFKIQLMSDKRRTEAHKFYQAIGFNATAEGFRMYL